MRSYVCVDSEVWYYRDQEGWADFVKQHSTYNPGKKKKAKKGLYKVKIEFTVNEDRTVNEVTKITNYGFGLEEEAMRIISLSSGDWVPEHKNCKKIKAKKIIELTIPVD